MCRLKRANRNPTNNPTETQSIKSKWGPVKLRIFIRILRIALQVWRYSLDQRSSVISSSLVRILIFIVETKRNYFFLSDWFVLYESWAHELFQSRRIESFCFTGKNKCGWFSVEITWILKVLTVSGAIYTDRMSNLVDTFSQNKILGV